MLDIVPGGGYTKLLFFSKIWYKSTAKLLT